MNTAIVTTILKNLANATTTASTVSAPSAAPAKDPSSTIGTSPFRSEQRPKRTWSVRARDVEGLIDTAGVHKFKINGYDIHFLQGRSDGSEGKRKAPTLSDSQCVACGWVLPGGKDQSSRFCSIKCKLIGSPLRREASNHEGVPEPFNKPCEEKNKDGHEGLQVSTVVELVVNKKSFRIRRRKGTPHRSPLS